MFYRRKIILALLKLLGGELEKIRLQKLLFLFTQKQEVKAYDFVPYKFGCYSYSANADLTAMVKRGMLIETETHFVMKVRTNFIKSLLESDVIHFLKGCHVSISFLLIRTAKD